MARAKAQDVAASHHVQGLEFGHNRTDVRFRLEQVPACEFYFSASDFRCLGRKNDVVLQFGTNSPFEPEATEFDLAIELILPATAVNDSFIDSVWTQNSAMSDEPFINTLERALGDSGVSAAKSYSCTRGLPADKVHAVRRFHANYSVSTLLNGQCAIEFFQIPFDMVRYRAGQRIRPGDQVTSVVAVIIELEVAYALYETLKQEWDASFANSYSKLTNGRANQ